MSNPTEDPQGASQISLEQLTEAAVKGTQRALEARHYPWGPVTIGFHFDRLFARPVPPPGDDPGIGFPDVSRLRTGMPISSEATGRISDRITQNHELGRELARALRADFAGTFQQLFALTPEQADAVRAASRNRDSTEELSKALLYAFEPEGERTFTLTIPDPASFSVLGFKFKFHLKIKTKNVEIEVGGEAGFP